MNKRTLISALLGAGLALGPICAHGQDWKTITRYEKAPVKEQLTERFLKYVKMDTQSSSDTDQVPSTKGQKQMAKQLAKELKKYGVQDVKVNEYSIVTGLIPSNIKKEVPAIAFLAHMDTAPEISGKDVKPRVIRKYNGQEIVINAESKLALNSYTAPLLTKAHGHDLIVASGGTLLGADDKTGLSIIMTMVQYLYDHPAISHGPITIVFTPDEETGAGIEKLDIASLGVDYAYTVDGEDLGELMTENFNAKAFTIVFKGNRAVHPGAAQNSAFADNLLMASDFHTLLPRQQRPETTADKRGFIYVDEISNTGDTSTIKGIIRAFSDEEFASLTSTVQNAFNTVKAMNPRATGATLEFKDEYKNMKNSLPPDMIALTKTAMQAEEITPKEVSARGGTDGATLAAAGIPAPDIFAGMYNIHSELEYADVDVMEASFRTLMRLVTLWAQQNPPASANQAAN